MNQQIRIFFTALMFYTRIPCPGWVDHSEEYINRSIRFFPLIGWIVGLGVTVAFLCGAFLFSMPTGLVLSLLAGVLITGAFHEDGFADTCDGFGGGWTKEKILLIMKDSRVGTYGVVGLLLLFGLKISLLLELISFTGSDPLILLMTFISAHALSRFTAATFIATHAYVRDTDDSKVKPVAKQSYFSDQVLSFCWALLPLLALVLYTKSFLLLLLPLPLYITKYFLGRYFTKWIGGYTGDCLGATQQVTEVVFYSSILLLWKFS